MQDESLSAFMDGECSPKELDRLLDALDRSPALKAQLTRMCMSREARRGLRCTQAELELSGRVMAALATDPVPSSKLVPFPARGARWTAMASLVGLATAASVAAVVVVSLVQVDRQTPESAGAALTPQAATLAAVEPPVAGFQAVGQKPLNEQDAEFRQQLNSYLIEYSNYRAQQGMAGTLGYARYAAHNPVQNAVYYPDEQR